MCVIAQVPGIGGSGPQPEKATFALETKQARGEVEPVPFETGKLSGKMATYENMRANPARWFGFSAWTRRPRSRCRPGAEGQP